MLGSTLALSAAVLWSVSVILFKQSDAVRPQAMNLFKNVVASALLLVTLPIAGVGIDWQRPIGDWALLVASGVLGIAVADTLIFDALRRIGPSLLSIVDLSYAPTIVTMSVLWLGESPNVAFAVGASLVVGGVAVAIWPSRRAPRASREVLVGAGLGFCGIVAMAVGVILAKPLLERGALVEITLIRLLAGALGQLLWIATASREKDALRVFLPSRVWRTLLPASVLGSYVAMLFWLGGFKWAPASTAAVLNQTSAVFTILLARVVLGETLRPRQALGAAGALAGAVVVLLG